MALLVPSSVIPLFRVASSRPIMGVYKISQFLEFLVLLTFLGMLGIKLIFMVELIFGNSDWVGNLRWSLGSSVSFPFVVLLITACASLCLMLWLAATPLKSATSRYEAQVWSLQEPELVPGSLSREEENEIDETIYPTEEPQQARESVPAVETLVESHSDKSVANCDINLPETIMESYEELSAGSTEGNGSGVAFPSPPSSHPEESASIVGLAVASSDASENTDGNGMGSKILKVETTHPIEKTVSVDGDMHTEKDDDEGESWEPEESSKDAPESAILSSSLDGPSSFRSLSGKSDEGGNGTGSLSRLVGLGRAARRQFAAVLDEFWGQLFDFHGQMTQEAKARKLDVLLGIDAKPVSTMKVDTTKELGGYYPSTGGRGSESMLSSSLYDSPRQPRPQPNSVDSSYGGQRGSSAMWTNNRLQLLDAYQNSNRGVSDAGERRYSSLRLPAEDSGERRYSSLRIPSDDAGERRYSSMRMSSDESGERRYSSLRMSSDESGERRYSSLRISSGDSGERRYSSLRIPPEDSGERQLSSLRARASSDAWNYQPVKVHGSDIAHFGQVARDLSSGYLNGQRDSPAPKSPALGPTKYVDPLTYALGQKLSNGLSSVPAPGFHHKLAVSRNNPIQTERSYYDVNSSGPADGAGVPANAKKYHSLPDISGLAVPLREQYLANKGGNYWDSSVGYKSSVGKTGYEPSLYPNPGSRAGVPMTFDEVSPSNVYREALPLQVSPIPGTGSLWSRQPFEQFGVADKGRTIGDGTGNKSNAISNDATSFVDSEGKLLQSFRHCIVKILKLEGSDWLFKTNDGADEELIDGVAARERILLEAEAREMKQVMGESQYLSPDRKFGSTLKNDETSLVSSVPPHCGEGCIWRADLIVSFGVWCIHRILNLSLMESRPELWGKYTYVLNRLQVNFQNSIHITYVKL